MIITDSNAVKNFVDRYFPGMKDKIDCYDSVQTAFCKVASEFAGEKPLKIVNITNVKEAGAEAKEIIGTTML